MSQLKAIIFDVDGTMSDTEEAHRVAFNETFKQNELDWYWDILQYKKLLEVTGGKERIKHFIDINHFSLSIPSNYPNLTEYVKYLHTQKNNIFASIIQKGEVPFRVGFERLVSEAREQNITLAIATTTSLSNVEALITSNLGVGAMDCFAVIGAGDMVANKKPSGEIYKYVLEKLHLNAKECVAIEDSYNGLCSSKEAHLATLITVNPYTQEHDFSQADTVVSSLGDRHTPSQWVSGKTLEGDFIDLQSLENLLG